MRDLSIHITESSLRLIMGELDMDNKEREDIIDHIIAKAKKYSCTNRIITITNAEQYKQATRLAKTNISDTKLMANTILFGRRQLNHRGIRQITEENQKDWLMCKDIADNANIFCRDFGLEKRAGYAVYIKMALSKMKIFSINFINAQHEYVCTTYESTVELQRDKTPSRTKELYDIFQEMAIELSGMGINYISEPTKYVLFKRAKDFCDSANVPFKDFLRAQFDGLEFAKAIPSPEQLVGPGASTRLQRYAMKEGNRNLIRKTETKKINWAKIRRAEEL